MTWQELGEKISKLPPDKQKRPVVVFAFMSEMFIDATDLKVIGAEYGNIMTEEGILKKGEPYLVLNDEISFTQENKENNV
jgi:hypothetical protein